VTDNGWGRSEFIETGGLRVHCRMLGDPEAPPVLLLHGYPQDSWMWRHQGAVLAQEHRVIAPDSRGFGHTEKTRIRVTRDLLAQDQFALLDALGIDEAVFVGHDWGGLIAFKAAVERPERVTRLVLIDTLTSVWVPWGTHGYWFKCEPEVEEFFASSGVANVRSLFTEPSPVVGGPLGGHPSQYYTAADVDHYTQVFDDPDVWFNAIEYYRHGVPFHFERDGRLEHASTRAVAAMWHHPLATHPDRDRFPIFAPEDLHKTYPRPTLFLYSSFLVPQAYTDGPPPDDYILEGNPYADAFRRHFPDLRCRGTTTGHFIPEEDPEGTNQVLVDFFAGRI
jgi:pimeloyl-ACP methyl ester carboxylesterase